MKTATIVNPKSGRNVRVRAWDVEPRAILRKFSAGEFKDARDLSWALLSEDASIAALECEDGDSNETNFALSVFENALDWTLGLAAVRFMRCAPKGKIVKPFRVACARSGDVFVITASGQVILA